MIAEISPFLMVVLIVLIVTVGRIYRDRHGIQDSRRSRRRYRDALPVVDQQSADEADRLKREVTRLNERIAVLERIATDPAKRLSAEIDALDDTKR